VRIIFIDRGIPYRELLGAELSGEDTVHGIADEQFLLKAPEAARQADVIVVGPNRSIASVLSLSVQLHKVGINTPIINLMAAPRWTVAGGSHPPAGRGDGGLHIEAMLSDLKQLVMSVAQPELRGRLVRGNLALEPGRIARWDDVEVPLTTREFDIVRLLVLSLGEFVSYTTLHAMGQISAGVVSLDYQRRRVASSLGRIEKKFHTCDATFCEIQRHPELGFRWRGSHLGGPEGKVITLPRTKS
jgi:hypothetical protein